MDQKLYRGGACCSAVDGGVPGDAVRGEAEPAGEGEAVPRGHNEGESEPHLRPGVLRLRVVLLGAPGEHVELEEADREDGGGRPHHEGHSGPSDVRQQREGVGGLQQGELRDHDGDRGEGAARGGEVRRVGLRGGPPGQVRARAGQAHVRVPPRPPLPPPHTPRAGRLHTGDGRVHRVREDDGQVCDVPLLHRLMCWGVVGNWHALLGME